MVIKFWSKGDVRFRFLSNFYKSFIEYPVHGEPMTFPTAEHAYQAAKCSLIEDARKFTDKNMTPEQAKAEGKRVACKENWKMEKRFEMRSILEAKFYSGGILAEELLKTGQEELVHYAPWDSFWGNGKDGNGLNVQGEILMEIRTGLRHDKKEEKGVKDKKKFPYGVGYYGEPHPDDLCHHCFKNDKEMANLQIDVDEICAVCKDCAVKHGYLSNLKEGVNVKWTSKAKQVFVFGSNTQGIHGAGQALAARTKWGAELGVGCGRTGNAYAIPTKIVPSWDKRQIDLRDIKDDVEEFLNYAKINHEIEFIVPRIGCGLAGYTDDEIGPMFAEAPKNVTFMEEPGFESWEKYRIKKEGLVICGTGHRPDKLGGYGHDVFMKGVILAEAIIRDRKPDIVISGGALGWDQMLAMAALNTGAALHIYAPCYEQDRKWTDESKQLYREILKRAALVKYIHEGTYNNQCMKDRNIAMVEASHEVWALWNGDLTGGTAHCINFAKACKKGGAKLKILNFWKNW